MQIDYSKRIFGLDLMRAVAILFVVFSHALWIVPELPGLPGELLRLMGVLGVEIFFVLSGFLIGRILLRQFSGGYNKQGVGYFWVRRWFRTLPNYYLILLVNIGIVLFMGRDLPESLWKYFFFIQNAFSSMDIFFTESWSLPIEEFTYLLAPILAWALWKFLKLKAHKAFLYTAIGMILFGLMSKVFYQLQVAESDMIFWNTELKAVMIYRLDAIFYGMLGAYAAQYFADFWQRNRWILFLVGVLGMLLISFGVPMLGWFIDSHPWVWNVGYLPFCSLVIALFLPVLSAWKTAPRIIRGSVTRISLISYSMYLLHYSVVLQLLKYFLPTERLSLIDKGVYVLVYLALTFVASYVLYRIYERPMMNLRDRQMVKRYFQAP
ncbi:acyltransferase family protein [Gilvibacter sediminis]|uniref:acyltransferase family protein n=1 Tax=Gilvibacter sediminis TaxID=379071 RepID=UPI0023503CF6|nr:acyltransferase [Gilvibacter sediminis]MDC7999202.1 acyltransferase [Gilvibacter sediminis]